MSALTKAMTPWEHELSQMLGAASHIIPTDNGRRVLSEISFLVDLIDGMIVTALDDPRDEKIERDIENRLWEWGRENEWLFYELTEAGWAA